jgi:hypothetical protein
MEEMELWRLEVLVVEVVGEVKVGLELQLE